MFCLYCQESIVITSQNLDAKFCNQLCYGAWRTENKPEKYKESESAIPTGKFPLFV